ncbi:hypothetical protein DYL80_09500 [Salmonella enterica subsp. enterica serovar Minnesota]|nr:hypothetical protein [Salmonella enterica subsp. enterica serovar Minnesota]MJO81880.1 hypothetical protein [Salmonella enterica subsp. enterica serovar Minnesota]
MIQEGISVFQKIIVKIKKILHPPLESFLAAFFIAVSGQKLTINNKLSIDADKHNFPLQDRVERVSCKPDLDYPCKPSGTQVSLCAFLGERSINNGDR